MFTVPRGRHVVVQRLGKSVDVGGIVRVDAVQVHGDFELGSNRHIGGTGPRVDQTESRVRAFVQDLHVFLRHRHVALVELHIELKFLLDLRLRDVEFLTFEVRSADQAVVDAGCYFSDLLDDRSISERYR